MKSSESSLPKTAAVFVDVKALTPWAKNPRKNDPAVKAVADSIKRFGFGAPLLARQANGEIIAGHTRLKAAIKLGLTEVPVRYLDLTESEAHALALADNKVGELAEWDDAVLAEVLKGMAEAGDNIEGLGWSSNDLQKMITEPGTEDGEVMEPPAEPITKPGDLWLLGDHRLLCGDSTKAEDVDRLMAGAKAVCMWTDPPYGIEYVGKTKDAKRIKNDGAQGLEAMLTGAFRNAVASLDPGAPWYCAHPPGAQSQTFESVVLALGMQVHQRLAWVKDVFVLGHSDYHYKHEPILYGYTSGAGRSGRGNHDGSRWYGDHAQTSVFEVPRPKRSEAHPTMKPVELVAIALKNSTPSGGLVIDPFLGSGTTLIACEQLNRVCCGLELDPAYCDVIINRWETLTGKKATLDV